MNFTDKLDNKPTAYLSFGPPKENKRALGYKTKPPLKEALEVA